MNSETAPAVAQIGVTSELMQNYRLASPYVPGHRIAAAYNGSTGSTELITLDTNGNFVNIYADPASSTGWSQQIIPMSPLAPVAKFDAIDRPDGSIWLCWVVPDTAPNLNQLIYSMVKTPGGWQMQPPIGVPIQTSRYDDIVLYNAGAGSGDDYALSLNVIINGETFIYAVNQNSWSQGEGDISTTDWCPGLTPIASGGVNLGVYLFGTLPAIDQNGILPAGVGIQMNTPPQHIWRYMDSSYSGMTAVPGWGVWGGEGAGAPLSELFAVRTDASWNTYPIHFHFDPVTSQLAFERIGNTQVAALAARTVNPGENSRIELFAIDANGQLYHTRQTDANRKNWTEFLSLEQDIAINQIVAGRNNNLYSEVFAIARDAKLYHIWQGDRNDTWHFDAVELDTAGDRIEELKSYTLHLTVYDPSGVPQTGQAVRIDSESPAYIDINGATCLVSPGFPWTTESLANGQVTITAHLDSLAAPRISAWTTGMSANDRVVLEASAPLRDQLAAVGETALLNARVTADDGSQTALLTGDAVKAAPDLANVIQKSMEMAAAVAPPPTAPEHLSRFHRANDHRVARYVAGYGKNRRPFYPTGPAAADTGGGQWTGGGAWQVDFSSGLPIYSDLSKERLAEIRRAGRLLPRFDESGLDSDWGSVWDYITEGIATLAGWVVDGLKTTFHLVVNGLTYLYEAVVSLVSQAFDLLEEVFRRVLVTFEPLFRWLGQIFGWSDIVRTKQAIVHSWQQMIQFADVLLDQLAAIAAPGGIIDGAKQTVSEQFAEWVSAIVPDNSTIAAYTDSSSEVPPDTTTKISQCSTANLFQSGLLHAKQTGAADAVRIRFAPILTPEAQAALDDFGQDLTTLAGQWQSSDAFANAVSYFSAIKDNPDRIFNLLAAGLLEIAQGLALLGLEAAQGLINAFVAALRIVLESLWTLLEEPLPIPFISALYKFATTTAANPDGDALTLLDMYAMTVAIPGTFLYKFTVGNSSFPDNDISNAPFPTDDSLAVFKATFTSDWMQQATGLTSTKTNENAAARPLVTPNFDGLHKTFQILYAADLLVYAFIDGLVDLQGTKSTIAENALSLGHQFGTIAFSFPWIDGQAHSVGDFENLYWFLQWINPAVDSFFFFKTNRVTKVSWEAVGPVVNTIIGAANLGAVIYITVADRKKPPNQQNLIGCIQGIMSAIPNIGKFVLIPSFRITPYGKVAVVILVILDFACDLSAVGLSIAEALNITNAGQNA